MNADDIRKMYETDPLKDNKNRMKVSVEFGFQNPLKIGGIGMTAKIEKAVDFNGKVWIDDSGPAPDWDGDPASLPRGIPKDMIEGLTVIKGLFRDIVLAVAMGEFNSGLVKFAEIVLANKDKHSHIEPMLAPPDLAGSLGDMPEEFLDSMDEMLGKLIGKTKDQMKARRTHDCAHCDSEDCENRTEPYVGDASEEVSRASDDAWREAANKTLDDMEAEISDDLYGPDAVRPDPGKVENKFLPGEGGPIPLPPEVTDLLKSLKVDLEDDDNKNK